jgi:acetyl-CoA decarbonylase/synthase complex subunit gamma
MNANVSPSESKPDAAGPAAAAEPVALPPALTLNDRIDAIRCRISNRFRMRYQVSPGLYAFNDPGPDAPVLVTANYRLSVNTVRAAMGAKKAWILVADTKGINVWCAAGKGTFCTKEIVKQINRFDLGSRVSHKTLILPQLGASGVAAHKLRKESGFSVNYGPVRATDIPAYLDNNMTATPAMRAVTFPLSDRLKIVPMELVPATGHILKFLLAIAVLSGITRTGILYQQALSGIAPFVLMALAAVIAGAVATPLLLPLLPFRAFTLKGAFAGAIAATALIVAWPPIRHDPFLLAFALVSIPGFSSLLGFLFTGSTTYTSPSGVKKELKTAWPLYIAGAAVSGVLCITIIIRHWGIV